MMKSPFAGLALSAGLAFWGAAAFAAEPTPQYSAQDLAKTFADKPDTSQAPGGECEKKGMVTGDDGICEPVKNERGFSLPTRASQGAASASGHAAASVQSRVASTSAAPVRHHAAPSRDLLITFKLGSAELTEQGRANARVFAQALQLPELSAARFELAGYTDVSGDKDKNLALSAQRAAAVKAFLTSLGVDPARLDTHGYGATDFVSAAHPEAAENRRVVASKLE